jgi:regulator of cell morphogenesis and NO signaling
MHNEGTTPRNRSEAMTTFPSTTTVGQLVTERPGLARVFERLGIDYCCGGRVPLAQACAAKGIDLDAVVRALDSDEPRGLEPGRADGTTDLSLGALADQIVTTHHAYLRRELPRLADLAAKVADAHAIRHPALRALCEVFGDLKDELESHMLKEERVLFPIIKQLEAATTLPGLFCGTVNNPIHAMEHEHASAGSALQRLRAMTDGYQPPDDACASYRALLDGLAELEADLHWHIHKENNVLFPGASALEAALRGA